MIRSFQKPIETSLLNDKTDDHGNIIIPVMWGVIVLAFVFIIVPAVVTILFR